jgi:uncharacterized membrane protein YeiH
VTSHSGTLHPATLNDWRYVAAAASAGVLVFVDHGRVTGIGGGALPDILAGEVPFVLRKEIYALASLLGALIIIAASHVHMLGTTTDMVAAVATFAFRIVSVWRGWNIPTARVREP